MIRELDSVVLTQDIDEHCLKQGDVGAVVHCYPDGEAFEVEFVTREGVTATVLTLTNTDIRLMNQVENTIHILDVQMNDLNHIVVTAGKDSDFDAANERLRRWKLRTVRILCDHVNSAEGEKLEQRRKSSFLIGQPLANLQSEADMYQGFLQALREELLEHPDSLSAAPITTGTSISQAAIEQPVRSDVVFLVHGHDELNLLRLERLLKDRWHLESVILKFEPGKGRTLIEKFEEEAERAAFAIILITPDDLIQTPDGAYTQARPNAVFELGWFYGRIGRGRVCILCKRGTKLHSDLDGINRVDFDDSIESAALQIESELREVGLL